MLEISVHPGHLALIDDEDATIVCEHRWYLYNYKRTLYAQNNKGVTMHRLILPNCPPGMVRHHKDGNGLNNQKSNLEFRTNLANMQQKRIYETNTTGCAGVKYRAIFGKYEVQITVNGKRHYLGLHPHLEDAIAARKKAELKYKGEERE